MTKSQQWCKWHEQSISWSRSDHHHHIQQTKVWYEFTVKSIYLNKLSQSSFTTPLILLITYQIQIPFHSKMGKHWTC